MMCLQGICCEGIQKRDRSVDGHRSGRSPGVRNEVPHKPIKLGADVPAAEQVKRYTLGFRSDYN